MRRAPRLFPPNGLAAITSSPWILVSVGVVVMVVLVVVAIGTYRGPGPDFSPGPPGPPAVAVPLPEQASSAGRETSAAPARPSPAVPGLAPRRTDPPSPTGSASAGSEPATVAPPPAGPANTTTAPPAEAPLEAQYQVVNTFDGGFVAEVRIHNTSRGDLSWVARVEYPGGRVVAAWLAGVPQGTFSGVDGTLTYRSGPDLAAGSSVTLRFHIEFADLRPASCTVSGRTCSGR